MSSIGANYAHIHVQQQRQKEKLKRMEEERAQKDGGGGMVEKIADDRRGKSNKVHPGGFMSPGSDGDRKD